MKFIHGPFGEKVISRGASVASVSLLFLLLLALCPSLIAQTPIPGAKSPASNGEGGFSPGWTLGTRFEGDYSTDAGVYNVGTALGYNFSRHFGLDA